MHYVKHFFIVVPTRLTAQPPAQPANEPGPAATPGTAGTMHRHPATIAT